MPNEIDTGRPPQLMNIESFLLPVSEAITNDKFAQPIFFQFYPEITGDSETANFEDVGGDIMGRAEPFSIYKNGSAREFTLRTKFVAWDKDFDEYWVQAQVNRIKALTKPIYDREDIFTTNSGSYFGPPLVIFTAGRHYINLPVVVKSVTATVPEVSMITNGDALPQVVEVEITVKTNYPYGYVPGYYNYLQQFPGKDKGWIDPSQMSFSGEVSAPESVTDVLVESAASGVPTVQANRGLSLRLQTKLSIAQIELDGWNKLWGTSYTAVMNPNTGEITWV